MKCPYSKFDLGIILPSGNKGERVVHKYWVSSSIFAMFTSIHPSSFAITIKQPDYQKIAKNCNLWRNYADIQDSFSSVAGIIGFYGDDKTKFVEVAGPGNWNDPDMVRSRCFVNEGVMYF